MGTTERRAGAIRNLKTGAPRKRGLSARNLNVHWRVGLAAGGNRIRTIGPARVKGLSAVADE